MKRCSRCHELLDDSAFRRNKYGSRGLRAYCRVCQAAYDKVKRDTYPSRSYEARTQERLRHPIQYDPERARRWRMQNPEKAHLHQSLRRRVQRKLSGRIQACSVEGCTQIAQAHHPNYDKPLSIVFLCSHHHHLAHTGRLSMEGLPIVEL